MEGQATEVIVPETALPQPTKVGAADLGNGRFFAWFAGVNAALLVGVIWIGSAGLFFPLIGFAGAFVSLFFAKWLACRAHAVRLIEPAAFRSDVEQELHTMVATLARRAGLEVVPAVGVYDSPDLNAFATGASRRSSLVAFSSALIGTLPPDQIEAVAAHEIAHIANRDMLAIVLLQGAINSVVLAVVMPLNLLRLLNLFSDRSTWVTDVLLWAAKTVIALALTFFGSLFVKAYSRRREFRADALAARLTGREPMIAALRTLATDEAVIPRQQLAYASFKIAGRSSLGEWFSTHPAMGRRIEALSDTPAAA